MDETNNNIPSGKRAAVDSQANQVRHGHMPVKRVSSARIQLLEESQC